MPRYSKEEIQARELLREWRRGYACAVAEILRTHADEVVAKDVLRCAPSCISAADKEDLEILKHHGLTP